MKKSVAIIGGGASSLLVADLLADAFEVTIYEKGKRLGRKFLVAGNGGFNLTNSVTGDELLSKYSQEDILLNALTVFDTKSTTNWLNKNGIETFTGSSGRVFPVDLKPAEVLSKLQSKIEQKGVKLKFNEEFTSFSESNIPILNGIEVLADYYIFALGGASWRKTGSDGSWLQAFNKIGIETSNFQASNCGLNINWKEDFKSKFEGTPLKNISIKCDDFIQKGEAVITKYGLEGNAIYPISSFVRNSELNEISIDFKPQNNLDDLLKKVHPNIKSKNYSHTFNLKKHEIELIKQFTSKEEYLNPELFCETIKSLQFPIESLRPIEESISTVGGINFRNLNEDFSLMKAPNIFTIGEMVNWDAPTGGFLLQGCFSIAHTASQSIINKG